MIYTKFVLLVGCSLPKILRCVLLPFYRILAWHIGSNLAVLNLSIYYKHLNGIYL